MPGLCQRCRKDGGEAAKGRLKSARERMEMEKAVLVGLKGLLPGVFGGLATCNVESIDERIEEVERRYWTEVATEESEVRLEW